MFKTKLEVDRHVEQSLKRINNETERNLRCFAFAKLYFNIGEYEQACRYVSSYLSVKPKSPEGHALLGKALEKLGRKEAALEAYRTSLQQDPKQHGLVIKVCELLSSEDVDLEQSGAKYFCDLAQTLDPNNSVVLSLKERLITNISKDPNEVTQFLLKELEWRPTDVNLRVRLLKHFLQNRMIKEAYKHAKDIEEKSLSIFQRSLPWYEAFSEVLVQYQRDASLTNSLNWEFWILSVSVLDRLVALSLDEHTDNIKPSSDYLASAFNFDQTFSKACENVTSCPDRTLVQIFMNHYQAQLYFHFATLVFKLAKKNLIQFKEAANVTLPVWMVAYHSVPVDLQSMWFSNASESKRKLVAHWHTEAAYRCSQAGHILLAASKDRKSIILEKGAQHSSGMWREYLFKKIFVTRDQQLKMNTSYFVQTFVEPVIRLPDPIDLLKHDETAQLLYPDSLHHYIWIALNNKLTDFTLKSFDGLQYTVRNLSNCAAETLNALDVQSFIYCATICAKSKLDDTKHLIYYNQDRPSVLPAAITETLGSLNQSKFLNAAYKMYKNEPTSNLGEVRLMLIKGIEVVRCVGQHGLDVKVLITLANVFAERANMSIKQTEIDGNAARAELYWKTALPLLERIKNNQMITYPSNRLFEYRSKEMPTNEAMSHIEKGKLFSAVQLMKNKDYEKALHIFESLKDPYASFYQSQIYKHMADQKTNQNKENVTSEMRSQNIILLSRARDCLYLTLDRLREPSVDRDHPLNAQLGTEIEKIERLLSRIDPDCNNRNECDGMSDENVSSDNSIGDHYVTTYTHGQHLTPKHDVTAHNHHSTPLRYSVTRQEARPSPERLDAQLRQLAASKDTALNSVLEQNRIMVESQRTLIEELKGFKDALNNLDELKGFRNAFNNFTSTVDEQGRMVKTCFQEISDVKKSVKDVVEDVQHVSDVVQEMKKEINSIRKDREQSRSSQLQQPQQQLSEEDLYVLDPEYNGLDYNINANLSQMYPNYPGTSAAARLPPNMYAAAPPALYPGLYPGLAYPYGGLGLQQPFMTPEQQLPNVLASLAAQQTLLPYAQSPTGVAQNMIRTTALTGQSLSQQSPKDTYLTQSQTTMTSVAATSTSVVSTSRAAPVNVVITSSDPLPTNKVVTTQPVLSVTIPPQHIKGNKTAHNYQIPLPVTSVLSVPPPAVLSKPPPVISTQSILSSVAPPMFSAISQTKSPKNVSLGLQIEKTLDETFKGANKSNISSSSVEEYDARPDFKAIVPLPDEVPVNTGEENETELFCQRAKLYRHVTNNGVKEWKERGVGNLKILLNPDTGKVRLIMRRDQIHKICANHFLTEDMVVTPMANNDRAYLWAAHDFADEEMVVEKFCVRFKTSEDAKKFHDAFEDAKKKISTAKVGTEAVSKRSTSKSTASSTVTTPQATSSLGGFVFTSTPTFKTKEVQESSPVVPVSTVKDVSPFASFTFGGAATNKPLLGGITTSSATTFSPTVITQNSTSNISFVPQKEEEKEDSSSKHHKGEVVKNTSFGDKFKLAKGSWECKNCYVVNDGKTSHCVACDTSKSGTIGKKTADESGAAFSFGVKTPEKPVPAKGAATTGFAFGGGAKPAPSNWGNAFKPAERSWECQACLVRNSEEKTRCISCETPRDGGDNAAKEQCKPGLKGISLDTGGQKFSFGMPASKSNSTTSSLGSSAGPGGDASDTNVTSSTSAASGFGDVFKPKQGTWECQVCYIRNEPISQYCLSCETPRDGSVPPKKDATAPTPSGNNKGVNLDTPGIKFTFGMPSSTSSATKFSFGNSNVSATNEKAPLETSSGLFKSTASTDLFKGGPFSFNTAPLTTKEPIATNGGGEDDKFVFGSPQKHDFEFHPRSPRRISTGQGDESDLYAEEEEEDNIYFKPVIPLPDKVEVKTGEEEEEVLYCHRAKLFRLTSGEWKERGIGDIKILRRMDNGQLRVVMRREQVLKICLNHFLSRDVKYLVKDEKTWLFFAADYSEGDISYEHFCIRFKNADIAKEFKTAVEQAFSGEIEAPKLNEKKDESEDDVQIVSETKVTPEEEAEAVRLGLPPKFMAYKQLPYCTCEQCKKDDEYLKELFTGDVSKPTSKASATSIGSTGSLFGTTTIKTPSTGESVFGTPTGKVFSFPGTATPKPTTEITAAQKPTTESLSLKELLQKPTLNVSSTTPNTTKSFSFTATSQPLFGSASSTKSLFSTPTNSFGSTTPTTSNDFGGAPASGTSIFAQTKPANLFGSGTPTTNIFGQNASSGGTDTALNNSPFVGQVKSTSAVTGSIFASTTAAHSPATGGSIFGGSSVGFSTTQSIFSPSTTPSSTTSFNTVTFGTSSAPATTNTSFFGTSSALATTNTSIFGNSSAPITTKPSIFGTASSGTSIFNPATNIFGAKPTSTASKATPTFGGTSIFGNKAEVKPVEATMTFGNSVAPGKGIGATESLTESDELVLKCDTGLSFEALASKAAPDAQPAFVASTAEGGDGTNASPFSFLGAGAPVFGQKGAKKDAKKETRGGNESDENEDDHGGDNHDPHFEPIVPLPDAVVVTTGEEDETQLFNERAKLYRFDVNNKEWKERGVGQMKILYHPQNGTYRLLLRREQIHKVVLNQRIAADLDVQPMTTSDKAWMWAGHNYTDDENNLEKLAVRFKNVELANKFKQAIDEAISKVAEAQKERTFTELPSTVQNYGIEDVSGGDFAQDGTGSYDTSGNYEGEYVEEEEEDEEDDDDEKTLMFSKRCTLSEQTPAGDWKVVTMGDLEVYYDPDFYAAKITVRGDNGTLFSSTLIGMNTLMDIDKNECTWRAVEWGLGQMKWKNLKATFGSESAAQEFHSNYLEGVNYAQEVGLLDELPTGEDEA